MKIKLLRFKSVKSTNDLALKLIQKKISKPTMIVSEIQTHGRGTMGKKWISQKGNLFISVFFELKETLPNFKEFSLINPIIIKKVLSTYSINAVKIKRPNDLLIKSKKVCGILQEVIRFEKKNFLIIGIGINTLTYPMNNRFKSTSLLECSNKLINNSEIIKKLKNSYESIFYNYKINKLLLKKI